MTEKSNNIELLNMNKISTYFRKKVFPVIDLQLDSGLALSVRHNVGLQIYYQTFSPSMYNQSPTSIEQINKRGK